MQYRKYGNLDYEVSLLGLGCMRLPLILDDQGGARVDEEKAFEMIRYAADHGVNYFDTAHVYHHGHSEHILGEALAGGRREHVKIVTKLPIQMAAKRADLRKHLETALKKLRTDYLDVYLLHNIMPSTWEEFKALGVIEEFEKFRQEGLIRAIGFSYHGDFDGFAEALTHYPWAMCQVQQNIVDVHEQATEKAIALAGKKNTALVIMEPLRGGGLVNAPRAVQDVYDTSATKRRPVEWAFRHLIDYPAVSCIISGMTTLEQLKDNIEIFSAPDAVPNCLSTQERDMIVRARTVYESLASIPCTGCSYCMPCPNGVNIPSVFARYNAGVMFESFQQPRRGYWFLTSANADAAQCVECGLCETQCPQHIPIIKELKAVHEVLNGWVE